MARLMEKKLRLIASREEPFLIEVKCHKGAGALASPIRPSRSSAARARLVLLQNRFSAIDLAKVLRNDNTTWDDSVMEKILPPPCDVFANGPSRWRWEYVDRKLSGNGHEASDELIMATGPVRDDPSCSPEYPREATARSGERAQKFPSDASTVSSSDETRNLSNGKGRPTLRAYIDDFVISCKGKRDSPEELSVSSQSV
ncbi:hypothetical protein ABIB06_004061 [Bradyrhizobium sp. LB8.2]